MVPEEEDIRLFFTRPYYQNSLILKKSIRGVLDVCGVADPATGWIIVLNGKYNVIGGTSAVAPMWAAYLGSFNIKTFVIELLYTKEKYGFHDIVSGNNGGYNATHGWDPATGLGSQNGSILNKVLIIIRLLLIL